MEFDHDLFDAEFLMYLVDAGIDIRNYEYKREDIGTGRITRQFGDKWFSFILNHYDDWGTGNKWEDVIARRASFQVIRNFQPWRDEIPVWIEDYLDKLHDTQT